MKRKRPICGACNGDGRDNGTVHGLCFHCGGNGYDIMSEKQAELESLIRRFEKAKDRRYWPLRALARFLKESSGYLSTDACNRILAVVVGNRASGIRKMCYKHKRRLEAPISIGKSPSWLR